MRRTAPLFLVALLCAPAFAQQRFLITDRTNKKIFLLHDINNNGVIDEPAELSVWWDATNAAGLPAPVSLASLSVRSDGLVVLGDNGSGRAIYFFRDLDANGNAQGAGESAIVVNSSNGSGVIFNSPQGIGFNTNGNVFISNSGTTGTNDEVYLLQDFNSNGSFQDAGDILPYVAIWPGGLSGNTAFVPFEIYFDQNNVGYVRDSGATTHGVYRFSDSNNNGRADDSGEIAAYFTTGNSSGLTIGAGFSLEPDRFRPGSLYTINVVTGPTTQQFIRLTDINNDNSANGSGEAVVAYSTTESSFTPNDLLSLSNGDLLFTEVIGKKVYRLHDANTNNSFETAATERSVFFANSGSLAADVRHMVALPTACTGDVNDDGRTDGADIDLFVAIILNPSAFSAWTRNAADVNCNGVVDTDDIGPMVTRLLGA